MPSEPEVPKVVCIWCFDRLTAKEIKKHPCVQPDFLDSDKVKYAKMIHPAHQSEWKDVSDSLWREGMHGLPWGQQEDEDDIF